MRHALAPMRRHRGGGPSCPGRKIPRQPSTSAYRDRLLGHMDTAMRAVWSFWSAPYVSFYRRSWARPIDHLLSWVVSVQSVMRHHRDAVLVTDTPGRVLLVERLGLPFTEVSTELDRLA